MINYKYFLTVEYNDGFAITLPVDESTEDYKRINGLFMTWEMSEAEARKQNGDPPEESKTRSLKITCIRERKEKAAAATAT